MADRIVKPDSGNDLVLQNDDASAKIEINEAGTIVATPSVQVDNLKLDANGVESTDTNGNIELKPNGTGHVVVGAGAQDATIKSNGNHDLILKTGHSTTGSITIGDGANNDIFISPDGSGEAVFGDGSNTARITTNGATPLLLNTNVGTNSGLIQINAGADANINLTPNGTGSVIPSKLDVSSGQFIASTAQFQGIVDGADIEGTAIKSTGESGGTKFLREDGDGTCSFQTVSAGVKTALNASGSAPIYACRAWVNFNGTGTVAIRASGNVSSITDADTGRYEINFTTAMEDDDYACHITGVNRASASGVGYSTGYFTTDSINAVDYSTGLVEILNKRTDIGGVDVATISVTIFR